MVKRHHAKTTHKKKAGKHKHKPSHGHEHEGKHHHKAAKAKHHHKSGKSHKSSSGGHKKLSPFMATCSTFHRMDGGNKEVPRTIAQNYAKANHLRKPFLAYSHICTDLYHNRTTLADLKRKYYH